jgi:elongation factor G
MMASMVFLYSIRLEPKTRTDQEKLSLALSDLARQAPTFLVDIDPDSGQIVIHGTGEQQLEQIVDRLVDEYAVEVHASKPQVAYRETIRKPAEAECRYIRHTGGLGHYAHVKIRIEPLEPGKGFEFINDIKGGVIASEYLQPIEQGIRAAMRGGVLAGYEIIDLKVTLFDGSYHDVDSNEMAFRIAGSIAFKEAARKAAPVMLEPVMAVEIVVPEQYTGTMVRDLNSRRGRIEGIEHRAGAQVIKADISLSEMSGYANQVSSASNGRATWSMHFKRYEQKPGSGGFGDGEEPGTPVAKGPQSGNSPSGRTSRSEAEF